MGELSTKNIGMKKYLIIITLLIVVIAILSGCESQETSEQDNDFEDETNIETAASPTSTIQPQTNPQPNNAQQQTTQQPQQQITSQQLTQTQQTQQQKPVNTEFIDIIDRQFVPLNIEIPLNTSVVWMHKDDFRPLIQHVIRVRTKGVGDELARSERLSKGQNLTYKFTEPGTYEYMDVLFIKDMEVGKIIVK